MSEPTRYRKSVETAHGAVTIDMGATTPVIRYTPEFALPSRVSGAPSVLTGGALGYHPMDPRPTGVEFAESAQVDGRNLPITVTRGGDRPGLHELIELAEALRDEAEAEDADDA